MDTTDHDERAARYQSIVSQFQSRGRTHCIYDGNTSIKFSTTFRNVIYDTLIGRGYEYTDDDVEWNLMWCDKMYIRGVYHRIYLSPNQYINHYRNFYELCRKDCLIKNLRRYKKQCLSQCTTEYERGAVMSDLSFWPETYILPIEYYMFAKAFKDANSLQTDNSHDTHTVNQYIMKPIASSQGKGIFLVSKLSQILEWKTDMKSQPYGQTNKRTAGGNGTAGSVNNTASIGDDEGTEKYIVQRYISCPLCIGGKKFDMRIYALVTSFNPLTVWLYRDGFARFASTRYSMLNSDIGNNLVHLTNVAVQKHGDLYDGDNSGGKMDITALKRYLCSVYGVQPVDDAFVHIESIIIHSLRAVQPHMINDAQSFELYGYDIMLDSDLKPWLIEVNGSPSLTASTQHDREMKTDMLNDMLTVIDIEKRRTVCETQIGGFDLLIDKVGRRDKFNRGVRKSGLGNGLSDREHNLINMRKQQT